MKPPKIRKMPSANNESDMDSESDAASDYNPGPPFRRMISEPSARDRFQRGGQVVCVGVRLNRLVRIGTSPDVGPVRCAIPLESLNTFNEKASEMMGKEYGTATVRSVIRAIIQPQCENSGKAYARTINRDSPCPGQVFVCHAYDANWSELVKSINIAFRHWKRKPTLWISSFALLQTKRRTVMKPEDAPFAAALRKADCLCVVRSKEVDIYSRLWGMYEMYLAKSLQIVDQPDGLVLAGPDTFGRGPLDASRAACTDADDKASLCQQLEADSSYEEVNRMVAQIRDNNKGAKVVPKAGVKAAAKAAAAKSAGAKAKAKGK